MAAALRLVIERERPHVVLIPASARGRDYGPRLAGELEVGMTGDCVNVDIAKAGRLLQTKPAFGGNIVSVIMGATNPQLATVRSRMFEPLEPRDVAGEIHRVALDGIAAGAYEAARTRRRRRRVDARRGRRRRPPRARGRPAGGGRSRSPARRARRSVRHASSARTAGVSWSHHVGLYGRPVAPRVLIAVGVPGDFEHVTGFVKADVVVALPEASWPADVQVAADAAALPQLVNRIAALA